MGTSTFSEYTVVAAISVAKIAKEAPLDKMGPASRAREGGGAIDNPKTHTRKTISCNFAEAKMFDC